MAKIDFMIKYLKVSQPTKEDQEALKAHFSETISDIVKKEGIQNGQTVIQNGIKEQMINLQYFFKNHSEEFLIAKLNSIIVGTIAYGKPSLLILNNIKENLINTPEIKSVYISPKYQKKGIGTFLIEKVKSDLMKKGVQEFCLDCGYKQSQFFWKEKLGEPQYILKDYWSKGEHHMIWKRSI